MGYLIDFAVIGIGATILAGLASLAAAVLPVKSKRFQARLFRGAATFILVWIASVAFLFFDYSGTHHVRLSTAAAVDVVPGLVRSNDQILRTERAQDGDTAQTYILVKITGDEVEAFASASQMAKTPFDAHTDDERGWPTPDWWPKRPCPSGVTYRAEPFANPPRILNYVINWCPSEGKAYVQHFDY